MTFTKCLVIISTILMGLLSQNVLAQQGGRGWNGKPPVLRARDFAYLSDKKMLSVAELQAIENLLNSSEFQFEFSAIDQVARQHVHDVGESLIATANNKFIVGSELYNTYIIHGNALIESSKNLIVSDTVLQNLKLAKRDLELAFKYARNNEPNYLTNGLFYSLMRLAHALNDNSTWTVRALIEASNREGIQSQFYSRYDYTIYSDSFADASAEDALRFRDTEVAMLKFKIPNFNTTSNDPDKFLSSIAHGHVSPESLPAVAIDTNLRSEAALDNGGVFNAYGEDADIALLLSESDKFKVEWRVGLTSAVKYNSNEQKLTMYTSPRIGPVFSIIPLILPYNTVESRASIVKAIREGLRSPQIIGLFTHLKALLRNKSKVVLCEKVLDL